VALEALSDIATGFDAKPVIHALSDRSAPVRRAACHVLALGRAEAAIDPLVSCLGDPDASVQGAAAAALQAFGAKATPHVLAVLHGEDGRAVDAALDVLWPPIDSVGGWPNDPVLHDALTDYAQREIAQARGWRDLVAAMPKSGRVTKLLCETLEARAARSEQRLVKAVGLLGNPAAMEQVGKSLKTRDPQARAAAIEALETLGHRQLARQIIPLLDDAPPSSRQPVDAAIRSLLASPDGWLRALAASAAGELQVREVREELHTLESDPDPLAREAARVALSQTRPAKPALSEVEGSPTPSKARGSGERRVKEGEPMETLQTVSTMERILLLREVPLFAELTPDDLKQVADIAGERWYGDGALLCRDGEEGNELFVLVSGRVNVYQEESGGAEKYLATREAGDFIGEMAILDPAPRSASVRAEGEVRTLVIGDEAFKAILRDRSEVSLALLRALSRRLRERE
jgi:HEAT repeat protein